MGEDWVVDSLLGFLQSPTWRYPVDNFIDQNCTVFDTEDENKFSYTDIHNSYSEMVDRLLENFTSDLGITPKQLAGACSQSSGLEERHRGLFEHILATEDFLLFKSIMVQKNIDMELQALKLVQQKLGHSPEAYQPGSKDDKDTIEKMKKSRRLAKEEEERIFQEVLEQSRKEYEKEKSNEKEREEEQIILAKQESLKEVESPQKEEQELLTSTLEKKLDLTSLPAEAEVQSNAEKEKDSTSKSPSNTASKKDAELLPPLPSAPKSPARRVDSVGVSDAASVWLEKAKADIGKDRPIVDSKGVTPTSQDIQDIKAREAYLRQQRDRLLKMKNNIGTEKSDSRKNVSAKPSVAAATRQAHTSPTHLQGKAGSHTRQEGATPLQPGERKKQSSSTSGVLCSAIADRLKKGQN